MVLQYPQPIALPALQRALLRLARRHRARLQVTLPNPSQPAGFVLLDPAAVPVVEPMLGRPLWPAVAARLHRRFACGQALWHVGHSDDGRSVVLTFHHAVADGHAALVAGRDLSTALAGHPLGRVPLPPLPLESVVDMRPNLAAVVAPRARSSGLFWAGTPHPQGPLRTALYPALLPATVLDGLRQRARECGATVHSALSVAAVWALDAVTAVRSARLCSPVSLRPTRPAVPETMGVYVGGLEATLQPATGDRFWPAAVDLRRRLVVERATAAARLGLLARLAKPEALATRAGAGHPNGRTATLEVSNLGALPAPALAPRMWFCQGNHYHGPLLNLSAVTPQPPGDLLLTLAVPVPLLDASAARAYLDRLRGLLHAAAEDAALALT